MRRADRAVTEFADWVDILQRADTLHLALHDQPYPYVVPLSFGLEADPARGITLYFHGAMEGKKHDLLRANPHVCVEASVFYQYKETGSSVTTVYESVIGRGVAERVWGAEAAKGLDLLMAHCGHADTTYPPEALDHTAVYRIALTSVTGKRNR
ncbi:MAG: pyridoxamine 5'-phosphate oxidase family protein [Oscillospiraceae bacterium]|jgi:nitroimidazol reductase NimA-like FMN-containing flavoprotein (pyridoxamine 5'-phosphate oxidase superfamily)|nr:pyridoxamine 5'-phosphate oxidase family protein [Oscillospiraceae bacterium]